MRAVISVIAASALAVSSPSSENGTAQVHDLLRTLGGFGPAQLAALDRGETLARVLRTDKREIAVIGAVRIKAPRERMIERYRNVANLRKSDLVMQVGTFGARPQPSDLAGLSFELHDIDALEECVPGDCPVRLSKEAIAKMQAAIDRRSPHARQQTAVAWRQVLAEIAAAYASGGDSTLPVYVNKAEPLSVTSELRLVYDDFAPFAKLAPQFMQHVQQFPRAPLGGTEDVLYWSKADLGIRPVVSITHQTIRAPADGTAYVATKRIYAMHYLDAGLGIAMMADDGAGGFYMTILERVRTRSLTGFTRAIVRSIVQDKTRSGVEKMLRGSKRTLESPSSLVPGPGSLVPGPGSPGPGSWSRVDDEIVRG